jgi:hypothetical protein
VAVTTREAREGTLGELAAAVGRIALASACLGEAYEQLSVMAADRLEAELYRPVQRALGRGKRTLTGFAERSGIDAPPVEAGSAGPASQGVKAFVEGAVAASAEADRLIAEIQDDPIALESGDAELRLGLSETREHLAAVPGAARDFLRTLGR